MVYFSPLIESGAMNGAAMIKVFKKTLLIGLSAAGVGACATPAYPTRAGYEPPPAIRPQYPVQAQQTQAPVQLPPAATPPTPFPTEAPPPPTTPEFQSRPLQPLTAQAMPTGSPPRPMASMPAPYRPPIAPRRVEAARFVADGKVVAATGMFRDYQVQKGDHLDEIAKDLETTRKVLVDANHLKAPYALTPGRHLKVPVAKAYVVQSGDTVSAVAKRFGVSAGELSDLNNVSTRGRLASGERLALPASFRDHGPTRLPSVMMAQESRTARADRRAATQPFTSPPASGPYVPSRAALAAAAERRAYPPQGQSYASLPPTMGRIAPLESGAAPSASRADIAAAGRGRFVWPVRGDIISQFGATGAGRRNDGVDVRSPQGTVVRSAAAGDVVYAGNQVPGFGNLVLVKHPDGWVTAYAHLDRVSVQNRQAVAQGQELGQVGVSGGAAEPQLHFEIRYAATPTEKAKPVDPLLVLPKLVG